MTPIRWRLFLVVSCERGHSFDVPDPRPGYTVDCPDDLASAPVVIALPTRCPRCAPQLRLVPPEKPS